MKIFISWSQELSRELAMALRKYLPCMIQELDVFMSKHDLESGARWSLELAKELGDSNFGIICLTPDNLQNPWILFESGALTKHVEGRACGLLFAGLTPTDLSGPLSQFQNRVFEKKEFLALLLDINAKLPTPLETHQLELIFEKWWPDLEAACQMAVREAGTSAPRAPRREQKEILEELVTRIRGMERTLETFRRQQIDTTPKFSDMGAIKFALEPVVQSLTESQRKLVTAMVGKDKTGKILARDYIKRTYSSDDLQKLIELGLVQQMGASFYRIKNPRILGELLFADEADSG
jgi:hypothetical protein